MKTLDQTLRPYQQACLSESVEFVERALSDHTAPRRLMFCAPMGTGKGTMQLAIRDALPGTIIVTSSLEVIRGFLERLGISFKSQKDAERKAEAQGVWTPVRLRNRILEGDEQAPPVMILDEAHHAVASNDVSDTLIRLMGLMPCIGFTATPFRGTPKGTLELLDMWGTPRTLLSWEQAVRDGYCSMPNFKVYPLLDDDEVTIRNGQFVVKALETQAATRFEHLLQLTEHVWQDRKPTMLALPSTAMVQEAEEACEWIVSVTQKTSFAARSEAFAACKRGEKVLAQISVVGEGVDLPWLHRIVDAKPSLSPVAWFQMIGRATRPGEAPEIVITNRNLERHGYLFEGMLPPRAIGEAQDAFGGASKRALGARSVGLEEAKKFKPLTVKAQGYEAAAYMLASMQDNTLVEWAIICKPSGDPIVARRESPKEGDIRQWGKWVRAELPADFKGFGTSKMRNAMSPKQAAWWERSAHHFGLAPEPPKSGRDFQVLPVLVDLRERL